MSVRASSTSLKQKNITIQNSQLLNSGLQNGISLTYSDNTTITKNRIKNLGRTGIVLYYGNSGVNISNNQVIDWMQRYGSYHYDAVKKSGVALDGMQDAAIDSYGPANQHIIVKNNQINLSAGANKVNPNNPLIAKKMASQNGSKLYEIYCLQSKRRSICFISRKHGQYRQSRHIRVFHNQYAQKQYLNQTKRHRPHW